jgi:hypothetical protein
MDEDEQYEDQVVSSWEKKQVKKYEESSKHDQDMAMIDALEEADKNWSKEIRTEVETWWREKKPFEAKRYEERKDEVADIYFTATVKGHTCKSQHPDYEMITCYKKWSTPVEAVCSLCDASLLVVTETIVDVKAELIPKCLGCGKALYKHKEGEPALCEKCDKIWCNINQHFQPWGEESLMAQTSPMPGQILRRINSFNGSYSDPVTYDIVKDPKNANLISSEVAGTLTHKPILDIDLPCKLISSTHAGHHHLYIDKVLSWETYVELLNALAKCGIIQDGYRNASKARGFSSVRLPWIKKEPKKVEDAGQD